MYIVERLTAILQNMVSDTVCPLESWQYNRLSRANVRLDSKQPSPTALFIQIQDFRLDMNTLTKREVSHVSISFLDKENKTDSEGLEQDAIITQMADLAVDFVSRVRADRSLRITNDIVNFKSVFYQSDSNRTGVTVELDIEQAQGRCLNN